MMVLPKQFFLTKGVGNHKEQLQSFELALRDAGIQICNLVNVSSIIPPGCSIISREEGLKICLEIIEQLKDVPGVHGIHIMAVGWEDIVPTIVERAGLLPRPLI